MRGKYMCSLGSNFKTFQFYRYPETTFGLIKLRAQLTHRLHGLEFILLGFEEGGKTGEKKS